MTTTDWIGLVGDVFTGLAVAGAAISGAFAWKSIQKANDTAKILDSMAVTLKESERTVFRMMSASQSMSEGLTTAMTYAQRLRVEDRLLARLARLERIIGALHGMVDGVRRFHRGDTDPLRTEQAALRAALSVIARRELLRCREVAGQTIPHALGNVGPVVSLLPDAQVEVNSAVDEFHARLKESHKDG